MSWSLGEISSLVTKAARGAGHPWGVAQEVGAAVRWLGERGQPGAEACAQWLSGEEGACPITVGLGVLDQARGQLPRDLGSIAAPMLILPFVARSLAAEEARVVLVDGVEVIVSPDAVDVPGGLPVLARVQVADCAEHARVRERATRVPTIDLRALDVLNAFANRTYAPATEASRLLGAGAGLSDND